MGLVSPARLKGSAWPQGIIAQSRADVESLLQSAGSSDHRSAPFALGESDPDFEEQSRGEMQVAILRKALNLWERTDTLEK